MISEHSTIKSRIAKWFIVAVFLVVIGALVHLPRVTDISILGLVSKILIFGLLAVSLDLVVGYAGLWSFCHATFFGAAAYTVAILTMHHHYTNFWVIAPISLIAAVLVATVFGIIALRVSGLHFLLVTLAMGMASYLMVIKFSKFFGGSDGIGGIVYPSFCSSTTGIYYFVLTGSILSLALIYIITKSPFGYNLLGIRENETRMKCLGYNVWLFKLAAFSIGGFFAGVAGLLYVYYNGLISPSSIDITASGLPWLMIIIGGTGTFWGGIIGCVLILAIQYFISSLIPLRWPMVIGICFILAVLLAREGIFTSARSFIRKRISA